jgi:hypothetical protein
LFAVATAVMLPMQDIVRGNRMTDAEIIYGIQKGWMCCVEPLR